MRPTSSTPDKIDPARHPTSFQDLMLWRVDNIILVSSLYDSFILAEGGHVNELILGEFLGMNLHHIPNLIRVSTGSAALEFLSEHTGHSLVVSAPRVADMDVAGLARQVREIGAEIPLVVMGYDNRELEHFMGRHDLDGVDRAFLWQGDTRILLAIVKYIEDRMNVAHDTSVMGVQSILVVEDSIRYYSSLMPWMYTEVVEHTRGLVPESLNLSHRLLRIKARPKILLCKTYEEAWHYFSDYQEHILGVVSDVEFPKDGSPCEDAGLQLAQQVLASQQDVPVLLHSSRPENEVLANEVGAAFLLKGSPVFLSELRRFMLENFGFGDFVFKAPDGSEVGRASDLRSLEEQVRVLPAETLAYHAARNHFSVWLKAHTEFEIAHRLRPRKLSDFASTEDLRQHLLAAIRRHRAQRSRTALVIDFDPATFDPERGFARIGGGSLGGKARGLAFTNLLLSDFEVEERFPGIRIAVPPCVVLGTDAFDEFIDRNELLDFALKARDDQVINERFVAASFSDRAREALRSYLEICTCPIAVRSSSLLEDSKYQPFAGIYETLMLPNNNRDLQVRLAHLLRAIKIVYASTFNRRAKRHSISTSYRLEEEKMAVILQRLVGTAHGDRFYPEFAGAAMSQNFYPTGPMKPEDGIVAVALGLGPTVVEGEECLRFCPRYPEHLVQFSSVDDILRNSQREFHALKLHHGEDGVPQLSAELERFDLKVAEQDGTLRWVGSTYSPENDAIYAGVSRPGVRLVSFAPILKHDAFPLAAILEILLDTASYGTGVPVEIEFAANLSPAPDGPKEFGFLQMRPVSSTGEYTATEIGHVDKEKVVCHSSSVLGNGRIDDLHDLVMVDYNRFERQESRDVAQVVGRLNADLEAAGRPYLLIGVGRWGSRDPHLGIPVGWDQIAGARVIVEAGFRDMKVTPSQGSHFFQNLMSHSVGYFTVNPEAGEGFVDWDWLSTQPATAEVGFVRHLRVERPFVVKMNGSANEGVILKPRP